MNIEYPNPKTQPVTTRLENRYVECLNQQAIEENITRTELMRRVLLAYISNAQKQNPLILA